MPPLSYESQRSLRSFPLRLSIGYLIVGSIYIFASDRVLAALVPSPALLTQIQSVKGWAFIGVTGLLLYMIVNRFVRARDRACKALEASLATQRLLLSELDHRVRNNLASLVGIVQVGAHGHMELEPFADAMAGRIRAMSVAYSLLGDFGWTPVPLRNIIMRATADAEERRDLSGGEVLIGVEEVEPLMLVLHELFSNSRRHGALRTSEGRIKIRWDVEPAAASSPRLARIEWNEESPEPVVASMKPGFGITMAQGIARSDLRGGLEYAPQRDGGIRIVLRVATAPNVGVAQPAVSGGIGLTRS